MSRKFIISLHLYLAAFFTPFIVLMAVSGTLYLLDYKGSTTYETLMTVDGKTLNNKSETLTFEVEALLDAEGIDTRFEYVKVRGSTLYTRPTSREHYRLTVEENSVEIARGTPDFVATIVELHKGHGPGLFRWMEIVLGVALIFIMLSGLILGLQSPALKNKTLTITGAGIAIMLLLIVL